MKKQYIYVLIAILVLLLTASSFLGKQMLMAKSPSIVVETDLTSNNEPSGRNSYEIDNDDLGLIEDDLKEMATPVSLTITNYQNTAANLTYTYEINIENVSGAYQITIGNTSQYLVFDAKGRATITLKSNDHATIEELPSGSKYTITQSGMDSYQTSINDLSTNTYTATLSDSNKVTFRNATTDQSQVKKNFDSNPNTLDPIGLLALTLAIAFITSLALIHHNKKTPRYEQDL